MGTGKTTVAPLVAQTLGLPFLDTDQELERRTGVNVPELWRTRGEGVFRELEEKLVRELLSDGVTRVVSFGGGTVTNRELRRWTLERATLVTLSTPPSMLHARTRAQGDRPTLQADDPLARITSLLEQRRDAYAECHLQLQTDTLSPEQAAVCVVERSKRESIVVPLGTRTYLVDVVDDEPSLLTGILAAMKPSSLLVVTDKTVRAARGVALESLLGPLESPFVEVVLPPGEEHKTLASVERLWQAALAAGLDRDGLLLAFGGGVVGDLAGFAASTLFRGVRVVQAPTTLLAMVDASVGGKTGFDLPAGKNLVGSFHQPSAVVADVAHLSTLPRRERLAGLAEVAKVALACDEGLWRDLETNAEALRDGEPSVLVPTIRRAIALKALVVAEDERDGEGRMRLNLGHTVGHALEAAGGFSRHLHGEAVALGLVAETLAAERLGRAPANTADRVRALLVRLGLPTEIATNELAAAWPFVSKDKKRVGQTVTLPLPRRIGSAPLESVSLRDFARVLGLGDAG